jgi:RNA recognition motif-containing protein
MILNTEKYSWVAFLIIFSDDEFRQYFSSYGDIEDCAILKDKRTGKPRGFGFVTYRMLASVE